MDIDEDFQFMFFVGLVLVVAGAVRFGVPLTIIMCVLAAIFAFAVGALWYILWKIQRRKEAEG